MGGSASIIENIESKILNASEEVTVSKDEAKLLLDQIREMQTKFNHIESLGRQPSIFCSYSWKNSYSAFKNGQVESSIGVSDPRDIIQKLKEKDNLFLRADFLESNEKNSFTDSKHFFIGCKAMVAFVSNEYVEDLELINQFLHAKRTLSIPIIVVVVGHGYNEGWDWQKSQIGLLIAGELYIDMTSKTTFPDKLLELSMRIQDILSDKTNSIQNIPKGEANSKQETLEVGAVDCPVFLSYCWVNSKDAEEKKEISSAVGVTDPRQVHGTLTEQGIKTWLDKVQLGKGGLFEDIAEGLLGAMVVVACVSTEYAKSENCCLEFMYSMKTLRLPIIPLVVGSDRGWEKSKVGLLLSDADPIDCTGGFTEEKREELENRVKRILHGVHKYTPQMEALKVGDCLELYYPNNGQGDLDYSADFNHDTRAIVGLEEGRQFLCSAYWWPVRVIEVYSTQRVKVEWLSYEGDWDQEASPENMRPTQLSNADNLSQLKLGDRVQAKLAQNRSYAWVDGTVTDFCADGRVEVRVTDPMTFEGSEHEGRHIEYVQVKKACIFVCI